MMKFHSHILGGSVVLTGLFASALAQAQDAPAAPPPAAAEAPAPAPAPPPPPAAEPAPAPAAAEPPPLPAPAPIPEPAAEAAPAAENPFKVTVGAGFRGAVRIQNPNTPTDDGNFTKLNDQFVDELNAELRVSGKVTDIIGWTANFTVDGRTRNRADSVGGQSIAFQAQALDIIGQLDFMDEFHVWLGRMLTPTDRSNFSGAWFMAPWNYSGALPFGYFGPRGTEEVGREVGATVWGDINKGKFKYYAMIGDLDGNFGDTGGFAGASPLYALRAQYAFIGAEPGFYGSSTYYGGQDIVSLGAGFQYQKDYACVGGTWNCSGSAVADSKDDLVGFNADVLAEFKTDAGTPGIEAAFYLQEGDSRAYDTFFYVVPGFTTGEILPANGKLNATVRFQMAKYDNGAKSTGWALEPSVAYLFKDYFAKLQLTYTMAQTKPDEGDVDPLKTQFVQLGFQIQQ
jgi:hypothetical protein